MPKKLPWKTVLTVTSTKEVDAFLRINHLKVDKSNRLKCTLCLSNNIPITIQFISHETELDFTHFFTHLSKLAKERKNITLADHIHYICTDACQASANCITKLFPQCTLIMCWFHVKVNLSIHVHTCVFCILLSSCYECCYCDGAIFMDKAICVHLIACLIKSKTPFPGIKVAKAKFISGGTLITFVC